MPGADTNKERAECVANWINGLPQQTSHPSLPPSPMSSARHSTQLSRAPSPIKKQALIGLDKPIRFNELYAPTEQLPEDVQPLYRRIRNIAYYRTGYLPLEDRARISRAVGDDIPDSAFAKAAFRTPATVTSDFDELQEILLTWHECRKLGRSELAATMLVHAPLLKLALKNHRYVDGEPMQTARICPPFMPPLADIGADDSRVAEGTMIDWALVLAPAEDGSRGLGRNTKGNQHDTAADKRLLRAVQTQALHGEPPESQTVNQTAYAPVMFRPIAVSIVAQVGGFAEDASVRLGIWTLAWHRRMLSLMGKPDGSSQSLRISTPRGAEEGKIISLPLIVIQGNVWRLLFACDRGEGLEIVGDVRIGETATLLGLYSIVAVLRELAGWIEVCFRKWIMNLFRINDCGGEGE